MSTYCFNHLKVNDKFLHQIKVIQTYQQNALAPFSRWKINISLILELFKRELTLSESSVLCLCCFKQHRLLMNCASLSNCFEFSDFRVNINSYLNNSRRKKKLFFLRACAQCPSTKFISAKKNHFNSANTIFNTSIYFC